MRPKRLHAWHFGSWSVSKQHFECPCGALKRKIGTKVEFKAPFEFASWVRKIGACKRPRKRPRRKAAGEGR